MDQTKELYKIFAKATGVTTDSRKVPFNSLFFALKGTHFDGNQFAQKAIAMGACAVVIDDAKKKIDDRYFLVNDVLDSLQKLAKHHRKSLKTRVLAIAGTNGKTTTKELISLVLGNKMKIVCTSGNLNNHIGVPLTLLNIRSDTDLAVVEMGANHLGEISFLCDLAQPDYGIITNIGRAHLEGFGSFPAIIRAKSELYVWLRKSGGVIFQNTLNPLLKGISKKEDHIIEYGSSGNGKFEFQSIRSDPFLRFDYADQRSKLIVQTHLFGSYNIENLEAAVTVGRYFELAPMEIKKALETYEPENNRSQVIKTSRNQVFVDSYNANPSSMKLAIHDFMKIPGKNKMVILGDMFELGEQTTNEHESVSKLLLAFPEIKVILIGAEFYKISEKESVLSFKKTSDAVAYFQKNLLSSYQILLKGSRKMELEKLLPFL